MAEAEQWLWAFQWRGRICSRMSGSLFIFGLSSRGSLYTGILWPSQDFPISRIDLCILIHGSAWCSPCSKKLSDDDVASPACVEMHFWKFSLSKQRHAISGSEPEFSGLRHHQRLGREPGQSLTGFWTINLWRHLF